MSAIRFAKITAVENSSADVGEGQIASELGSCDVIVRRRTSVYVRRRSLNPQFRGSNPRGPPTTQPPVEVQCRS